MSVQKAITRVPQGLGGMFEASSEMLCKDSTRTSPISQGNISLNFQAITSKLSEPKKFKGWVLGNEV